MDKEIKCPNCGYNETSYFYYDENCMPESFEMIHQCDKCFAEVYMEYYTCEYVKTELCE